VPAGRKHIEAMLKVEDDFSDLVAASTIGFGNAEMVRSGHSLLFPSGSTVDIYVRTASLPNVVEVDLEATYVADQGGYTVWHHGPAGRRRQFPDPERRARVRPEQRSDIVVA